jgi:hypothetical protein
METAVAGRVVSFMRSAYAPERRLKLKYVFCNCENFPFSTGSSK